jgi:hypothetical protein
MQLICEVCVGGFNFRPSGHMRLKLSYRSMWAVTRRYHSHQTAETHRGEDRSRADVKEEASQNLWEALYQRLLAWQWGGTWQGRGLVLHTCPASLQGI